MGEGPNPWLIAISVMLATFMDGNIDNRFLIFTEFVDALADHH